MDAPTIQNNICRDYKCYQPTPRSSFAAAEGPLCAGLAEYLYDPANCDPGYWCGCRSTDPDLCFPSNSLESGSLWGGHYTVRNETSGQDIVLTGWFDGIQNKCPQSYYCPGNTEPFRCVDLCEPGMICPDSSQMMECPDGKFCPVGTTVPKSCSGLEICSGTGQRRYGTAGASGAILAYLILCIFYLYYARHVVTLRARRVKSAKMAVAQERKQEEDGNLDAESTPGSMLMDYSDSMYFVASGTPQSQRRRRSVSSPQMTIDIEFKNLLLTIPNVGTIMRDVSGEIKHGQLTAVMGPSGAGKTTFVNLMSGKIDRSSGTVKVNGKEIELTRYRKIFGYVPQEDVMMRDLTVEENVTHSALMRLPRNWTREKKRAQVDEILEALEIDHVRDIVVGDDKRRGISGGERKRVNIAMEMVTKPSLLCLDEPTSGLDSTASFTVIRSLKDMVASGANIVACIHQPKFEVFKLFDQVLLLGQGGMTVYHGPTSGMTEYFDSRGFPCPSKANPADFYMDVLTGIVPHATDPNFGKEQLLEAWMIAEENHDRISLEESQARMRAIKTQSAEEEVAKKMSGPFRRIVITMSTEIISLVRHLLGDFYSFDGQHMVETRKVPGRLVQASLLFQRACLQRIRAPHATVLNIVLMALAGAVLPSLVDDDDTMYVGIPKSLTETDIDAYGAYLRQNITPIDFVPQILLNIWLFLLIVSCLSVNVLGGSERTVFFRETATGQHVLSYWLAKTFETFLWLPAYTCGFVLLGYSSDAWLLQALGSYWIFCFFTLMGFYGFGMLSSLLVGTGNAALLSLVFGIVVAISFSGTVNSYGDASSGYQKFINVWFLFWSTQGISSLEYDEYRYAFDVEFLNDQTPDKLSTDFGRGEDSVGAGVGLGFDLHSSYARNLGFCALTAFAWHLLVLWTLKTKDHRKHR